MKNLGGLLWVMGYFLLAAMIFTLCVVLVLGMYGTLLVTLVFVMAKSYVVLGNTWFFVVWPAFLIGLVTYKTRKWWMKKFS